MGVAVRGLPLKQRMHRAASCRKGLQPASSSLDPYQSESSAPIHRLRCSVTAKASSGVITSDKKSVFR